MKDAFLFAAALEDSDTCQLVLELVLGRPVGPVKVRVERSVLFSKDFRYVRLDVASLKPGQSFLELRPCYIIFICTYDPFDANLYRYTYEERCIETGESLGDETQDVKIQTLHQKVAALKHSRELEGAYMTMEEYLNDRVEERVEERVAERKAEEKASMKKLLSLMIADGLVEDISRMLSDNVLYESMLEKYHLN